MTLLRQISFLTQPGHGCFLHYPFKDYVVLTSSRRATVQQQLTGLVSKSVSKLMSSRMPKRRYIFRLLQNQVKILILILGILRNDHWIAELGIQRLSSWNYQCIHLRWPVCKGSLLGLPKDFAFKLWFQAWLTCFHFTWVTYSQHHLSVCLAIEERWLSLLGRK